jgi:hypothetical protein
MVDTFRSDEGCDAECGDVCGTLNVMDPAVGVRTCCNRGLCATGVTGGACAMCAMPPVVRSTLSTVVGLVLAAILRNVLGSERYEGLVEVDMKDGLWEGEGDGGEDGGSGRTEASSSASWAVDGDQVDSIARDERRAEDAESPSSDVLSLSVREDSVSVFKEIAFCVCAWPLPLLSLICD